MSDLSTNESTSRTVSTLAARAVEQVLRCPIELDDAGDPRIPPVLAQVHPPGDDDPPPWAMPAPLNLSEAERSRLAMIHAGSADVPAGTGAHLNALEAMYNTNAFVRAAFGDDFEAFLALVRHEPGRINLPELETDLADIGPKRGPLRAFFEHLAACDDRIAETVAVAGFKLWRMGPVPIAPDGDRWAGALPEGDKWRGSLPGGYQVMEVHIEPHAWAAWLRAWLHGHGERRATVLFHCGPDALPAVPDLRNAAQRLKRAGSPDAEPSGTLFEAIARGDLRAILDVAGTLDTGSATQTPEEFSRLSYSDDFTSIAWGSRQYRFNAGRQAESMRLLIEDYENGGKGVREQSIGGVVAEDNDNFRLRHVFRAKSKTGGGYDDHPAWGTLIARVAPATYTIRNPDEPTKC